MRAKITFFVKKTERQFNFFCIKSQKFLHFFASHATFCCFRGAKLNSFP